MEEREAEFDASYQVEVTVAEIYMEKIRDLLHHQQQVCVCVCVCVCVTMCVCVWQVACGCGMCVGGMW